MLSVLIHQLFLSSFLPHSLLPFFLSLFSFFFLSLTKNVSVHSYFNSLHWSMYIIHKIYFLCSNTFLIYSYYSETLKHREALLVVVDPEIILKSVFSSPDAQASQASRKQAQLFPSMLIETWVNLLLVSGQWDIIWLWLLIKHSYVCLKLLHVLKWKQSPNGLNISLSLELTNMKKIGKELSSIENTGIHLNRMGFT